MKKNILFTVLPESKKKLKMTVSEMIGRATEIVSFIEEALRLGKLVSITSGKYLQTLDFQSWVNIKNRLRKVSDSPETYFILELSERLKTKGVKNS